MSLLTLIKAQFGKSNTPANNFVMDASADNGTLKLARGNAGATTQDILTVDASGNVLVDGNNLNLFSAKSLAADGYQKLPSGLIIQWGIMTTNASGDATVTFPIAFPNAVYQAVGTFNNSSRVSATVTIGSLTTSTMYVGAMLGSSGVAAAVSWVAIGR